MTRAWIFKDSKRAAAVGEDSTAWSVGWVDPAGKRKQKTFAPGSRGKTAAERFKVKVEAELMTGVYDATVRIDWSAFRAELQTKVLDQMAPGSRQQVEIGLAHFARIIEPVRLSAITSKSIDEFIAARRKEPRRKTDKDGPVVAAATINKDLRAIRATLRRAKKWGYLKEVPEITFVREPGKLATYIDPSAFAALYGACDVMDEPSGLAFPAADWWRGLLILGMMTGWRIGSMLSLRWADVDLNAATALSRCENNKAKRDALVPLAPNVIEHLKRLKSFEPVVFPWKRNRRKLFGLFHELQAAAKVKPAGKAHYGFHDLRRAFATMNAGSLSADALQNLMGHRDYQTTQRYVNMAAQLKPAIEKLFVPQVTQPKAKETA